MSENNYGHPGNEGPERDPVPHDHRPYWKRAHHDWRVWVGLFFMFAAITIYVMSENLSFFPRGQPHQPSSAIGGGL
jgi:hypothetical protein